MFTRGCFMVRSIVLVTHIHANYYHNVLRCMSNVREAGLASECHAMQTSLLKSLQYNLGQHKYTKIM